MSPHLSPAYWRRSLVSMIDNMASRANPSPNALFTESFPVFNNFVDYPETLKAAINQSNHAMALIRIDSDATGMFERYN